MAYPLTYHHLSTDFPHLPYSPVPQFPTTFTAHLSTFSKHLAKLEDNSESPTERTLDFPQKWRAFTLGFRCERITGANMDACVNGRFGGAIPELFTSIDDAILKADFLRYLILLREGGVWANIDTYPHRSVAEWVPEAYHGKANLVMGIENDHHKQSIWPGSPYSVQLYQYVFLAKPGHAALKSAG